MRGQRRNPKSGAHFGFEVRTCERVSFRYGKEYTDTSSLRYGRLLVMADQVGVNRKN